MYRNAWWNAKERKMCLRTWDKSGNRISGKIPFKPYLYIESEKGNSRSIFGTKLEKKEFKSVFERQQYMENYGINRFFGCFEPTQQFLIDAYWNKVNNPDFAQNPLRTIFYDIEVDPLENGEFPNPEEAKAEINIITAWDSLANKYFVFSKYGYNGNGLKEDTVFINCGSEKELLKRFMKFWIAEDYPDIVSGWNSDKFDFPYIRNRIIKLFNEEEFLKLSPYGEIRGVVTTDKVGREVVKYDIAGVSNLDYMDVYAKFKVTKQESYKLDFIAEQEIGYGKVDYHGMTIYEFMSKYWDRFVEYNVRDVELLVKMEEKLRYYQILRVISNLACTNYSKGLTTIPITNGALAIKAKQRGEVLHTFLRKPSNTPKPGGFVSSHAGFHRDIITVDATSLYPSIIMSNNISPETKVGIIKWKDHDVNMYGGEPTDRLTLYLSNHQHYELTRGKLQYLIQAKDLILSANGCLFSQKKEGIFPEFIRDIFSKRVNVKSQIKRLNKENEKLENKLKQLQGQ